MQYLYGSGLLFAAILLLFVFRIIFNRPGANHDHDAFGATEAVAVVFTTAISIGVSKIGMKAVGDWSMASTIEMIGALAGVVAASIAVSAYLPRLLRPAAEAETSELPGGPPAPTRNRRGRPTDTGNPTQAGGSRVKKRAA